MKFIVQVKIYLVCIYLQNVFFGKQDRRDTHSCQSSGANRLVQSYNAYLLRKYNRHFVTGNRPIYPR